MNLLTWFPKRVERLVALELYKMYPVVSGSLNCGGGGGCGCALPEVINLDLDLEDM